MEITISTPKCDLTKTLSFCGIFNGKCNILQVLVSKMSKNKKKNNNRILNKLSVITSYTDHVCVRFPNKINE